jgi:hypothetical protein
VPEPLELRPLDGWRIIAEPAALDAAMWPAGCEPVRISADDAFVIGGATPPELGDPHAIVTPEHGFAGVELAPAQLDAMVVEHIEWQLPARRPAVAQGQIAGVPAKLVMRADNTTLLLVACAAAHELTDRLSGWQR